MSYSIRCAAMPSTSDGIIITGRAVKRWGRGRTIQEVAKVWHQLTGHPWGPWTVEPPEDELGRCHSPEPDEMVFCFRACRGGCGAVEHTIVPFSQHQELPL